MTNPETQPMPAPIPPAPEQQDPSRFEAMRERVGQKLGDLALSAQIAMSSARIKFSEHRTNRAAKVVEKMDHKEALYEHLGTYAKTPINESLLEVDALGNHTGEFVSTGVVHRDPDGRPPRIRSRAERSVDRRISKRKERARKATVAKFVDDKDRIGKHRKMNHKDFERAKRRSKKIARKHGLTEMERTMLHLRMTTNYEPGMSHKKVDLIPDSRQTVYERSVSTEASKSKRALDEAVRQPVLRRWRVGGRNVGKDLVPLENITSRRGRAIGTIKANHETAEKQKKKKAKLIKEKRERQASR